MMNLLQLGQFGRTISASAGGGNLAKLDGRFDGAANSSTTTVTANFVPFSTATGQHVFVVVKWEEADTTTSCADSLGNTYTALLNRHEKNIGLRWFYCLNATVSDAMTVTVTFGAARGFKGLSGFMLKGSIASVTEYGAQIQSGGNNLSTPSFTVAAGDIALAGSGHYPGDSSNTYSGLSATWNNGPSSAYRSISSAVISTGATGAVTYTGTGTSAQGRALSVLHIDAA